MKILLDTSIVVKIDRKDPSTVSIIRQLSKMHQLLISNITISEILTGAYLNKNPVEAVKKAKKLLRRMDWIVLDPPIAEKVGEINAYLIKTGKTIELADIIIGASCIVYELDVLLTFNQDHFKRIPNLEAKTFTPQEFWKKMGY